MAFLAPVAAWIGSNIGLVSTVASVGSGVLGAAGAISGARNQAAVMEANAGFMEQEARDRRLAAIVDAERLRRRQRIALSGDRAQMAQAGALSGTSLDLLDQNSVAAELDAMTVEYGGTVAHQALPRQAAVQRAEAGGVRSSGVWSAAGNLISGVSRIDPLNLQFASSNVPLR